MVVNRSLDYLELAKKCLFEPDRRFHKNELVSEDFLVAELDLDIREHLVIEEGTASTA
jgi:hypothetical protein